MRQKYKRDFLQAGKLASEVRNFGKSLIKKGASYNEVISKIRKKIAELGAIPAFPPQIALDDVAAHFLPHPDNDIIFVDEVVKLDIGICYEGAIGDCAITVDLSGHYQKLVDAAEAALLAAEQHLQVGRALRDIGRIIEEVILSYDLVPVRNLGGHGLGCYQVHTAPSVPNYPDERAMGVIKPGMTFAIEPFVTNGKGLIYDADHPTIFKFVKLHRPRSPFARQILDQIRTFHGLPFALHDLLAPEISTADIEHALTELLQIGAIAGYPPLIEEAHGMVAQAENSVLIDEKGEVFITTRSQL